MTLPPAVDVAIRVVVFFLMWLVGLRILPADFRRIFAGPRLAGAAVATQTLLLPLFALGTGWLVGVASPVAVALLVFAASPAGVLSNGYTLVAHGNVALSIAMTAAGTLLCVITLPFVTDVGLALLAVRGASPLHVPLLRLTGELILTTLVPVGLGMALRAPILRAERLERRLQSAGVLATAALVAAVLLLQWDVVRGSLPRLGAAVVIFTVLASLAALGVAAAAGATLADRSAVIFEFPCRNLGLAVLVAVDGLGRPEVAGLAGAFFLIQLPILLLLSLALRRAGTSAALATS